MKSILKSAGLLIIGFILWTCEHDAVKPSLQKKDVVLKNTEVYSYDFHISGDEEGANIKTQATHYEISKLVRDSSTNWSVVYTYKPEAGYVGPDYVEIETCTGGEGINCTHIERVQIHFTISE